MEVKVGDKIRIIHLTGEDSRYDGREGSVEYIDAHRTTPRHLGRLGRHSGGG